MEIMHVELWVWAVTIAVLGVILLADFVVQLRRPHEPTFRESAIQVSVYISLALLFTFVIGGVWGPQYAAEYIAGWVTEYSLSVDNIFVFLIIFTQFAVPKRLRSQVLLIGIAIALVLRLIFIVLGAAFIERFSWAFYVFGAFGLWARASEDRCALADGMELADSWATDAHKWLNVPYDSGMAFVADANAHRLAMTIAAPYKVEVAGVRDQFDLSDAKSREQGLRSLLVLDQLDNPLTVSTSIRPRRARRCATSAPRAARRRIT